MSSRASAAKELTQNFFLFAITRQLLTICLMPTALRHSTNGGDWKDAASRLASSLVNVR